MSERQDTTKKPAWSVASILGFILAFLMPPVGLPFALIGLARTRDGRRRGRELASAGVAVSIPVTITVALAGLILSLIVPGMLGQLSDAGLIYPGA